MRRNKKEPRRLPDRLALHEQPAFHTLRTVPPTPRAPHGITASGHQGITASPPRPGLRSRRIFDATFYPLPSATFMEMSPALSSGAVLLGHGSREPATETEIRELCAALASAPSGMLIRHAFLNQEPKLDAAVQALVDAGCTQITILPLLVFIGRHMIDDVPEALERLRAHHPAVTFRLEPHLFRLPGFSDLIAHTLTRTQSSPSQERSA